MGGCESLAAAASGGTSFSFFKEVTYDDIVELFLANYGTP